MEREQLRRQYGLWDSPISARSMAGKMGFSDVAWDRDGSLVWLESRAGKGVLMAQPADGQAPRDLNSELFVRGKVGYGGGDFTVGHGMVYFSESDSGRIFRQPLAHGPAQPITPAFGAAAGQKLSPDGHWLVFVHTYEDQDSLAIVDANGANWPQQLHSGQDFYMQPAWHPDGDQVAWVAWDHPNMPWDGTTLYVGRLKFDSVGLPVLSEYAPVAGGKDISIFQPEFSPDGRSLAYVSDESGWWQLYLLDLSEGGTPRQLTHVPAEHGLPGWIQGMRTYGFAPDGALYFLRSQMGTVSLWRVDPSGGVAPVLLDDAYTYLEQIAVSGQGIAMIASGERLPSRVISVQPVPQRETAGVRVWRRATSEEMSPQGYARPQAIEWTGQDGGTAYGLYYPPTNPVFEGIGKPPLIVNVHGGPTGLAGNAFNLAANFFTSRGYAFLEVNHRGSAGFGRAYRNKLRGNWGIYDVQDSVSGAQHLAAQGLVDGGRMVIMGGSAGGFTVLKALQDYPGFFKAGICRYGVSNQFTLALETHKFEQHYNDSLIGPLPEAAEVYRERSPISFVDRIQDPLALFQGEDDRVVLPSQSEEVAAALRKRGVPHIYHLYPGEGHGFRKTETIEHVYTSIEKFLRLHVIFA